MACLPALDILYWLPKHHTQPDNFLNLVCSIWAWLTPLGSVVLRAEPCLGSSPELLHVSLYLYRCPSTIPILLLLKWE